MSSSVGSGFSCNSAMLVSIMPGVQKPHCSPCSCLNAAWMGCRVPPAVLIGALQSTLGTDSDDVALVLDGPAMVSLRFGGGSGQPGCLLDRGVIQNPALEHGLGPLRLDVLRPNRRQSDSRRPDLAIIHLKVDRNGDGGEVTDLALQLEVRAAGLRPGGRYPDLAEHLVGFEDGTERPIEEVARLHYPAAGVGAQDELGV